MFKRNNKRRLFKCMATLILLAVLKDMIIHKDFSAAEKCELLGVIDGDTISVLYNNQQEKVRLIGIDAPESVHADETRNSEYGVLSGEYIRSILADAEYVYLEFDATKYDTYDRLLAYVYLEADISNFTESLNYMLVSGGYAVNKEYPPNTKYAAELLQACQEADNGGKGLWIYEDFEKLWEQ